MNEFHLDRSSGLAAILLAALMLATFYPVISCQFINVDDIAYVTGNEHVRQGLTLHNVWWALTAKEAANWHPVTWLSHMLDVSLFGLKAGGHHGTNLLIHTMNVVLLFVWLRVVSEAMWKSFFVAAVFGLHPLALESVAFIAERKNVLSMLFFLLMLFAYVWYVRQPRIARYLLVALVFTLGLMCKPMLVTVPFVLLLLDYWPLRRLTLDRDGLRSRTFAWIALEKLPLLLLSLASSILTLKAQALDSEIKSVPLLSRIANAVLSYGIYLKQMVWPVRLAIFYPYRDLPMFSWPVVVSLLTVCVATALVVWQIKKRPYLAVGWFWYLGTLIPVVGLVHVGDLAHADRYTYLPLMGIFIALSWGGGELVERFPHLRYGLIPFAAAAIVALAVITAADTSYWHDGITISEHSIAVTGSNCLMERSLGETFYAQGRVDEALVHLTRSVQDQPTDVALYDIGTIKLRQNNAEEAVYYFQKALEYPSEPQTLAQIHNNLAVLEMQQGLLADAEKHFTESVALDPGAARHRVAYGWMLAKESRYSEAVTQFEKAITTAPDAMTYFYLGSALEQEGNFDRAKDAYRKTLVLAPRLQEAQVRLNAIAAVQR